MSSNSILLSYRRLLSNRHVARGAPIINTFTSYCGGGVPAFIRKRTRTSCCAYSFEAELDHQNRFRRTTLPIVEGLSRRFQSSYSYYQGSDFSSYRTSMDKLYTNQAQQSFCRAFTTTASDYYTNLLNNEDDLDSSEDHDEYSTTNIQKDDPYEAEEMLQRDDDMHLNNIDESRYRKPSEKSLKLWDEYFDKLVKFKRRNGHCLAQRLRGKPKRKDGTSAVSKSDAELARWVATQRRNFKLMKRQAQTPGKLSRSPLTLDNIERLDDIGFVWDVHEAEWQKRLALMRRLRQDQKFEHSWEKVVFSTALSPLNNMRHNTTISSQNSEHESLLSKEDMRSLANWAVNIRQKKIPWMKDHERDEGHLLRKERRLCDLDEVGFIWTAEERTWWNRYYQLKEHYRDIHRRSDSLPTMDPYSSVDADDITKELTERSINFMKQVNTQQGGKHRISDAQLPRFLALWCNEQRYLCNQLKHTEMTRESEEKRQQERSMDPTSIAFSFNVDSYRALSSLSDFNFDLPVNDELLQQGVSCKAQNDGIEPSAKDSSLDLAQQGHRTPKRCPTIMRSWDEQFQALVMYKAHFGDALVPQYFDHNSIVSLSSSAIASDQERSTTPWRLGFWVMNQRKEYQKFITSRTSHLTQDKIDQLNSIGFTFYTKTKWDRNYKRLKEFYTQNGHTGLLGDTSSQKLPIDLERWAKEQLLFYQKYRNGTLPLPPKGWKESRLQALEDVGFASFPTWDDMLVELSDHVGILRQSGRVFAMPMLRRESSSRLQIWVREQRLHFRRYLKGLSTSLTKNQFDQLQALGFYESSINPAEDRHVPWEERFQQMVNFKEQRGHCDVPTGHSSEPGLRYWTLQQRKHALILQYQEKFGIPDSKSGPSTLTPTRKAKLENIGFNFEDRSWDDRLDQWKTYRDFTIAQEESGKGEAMSVRQYSPKLNLWVRNQRMLRKRLYDEPHQQEFDIQASINADRLFELEQAGFQLMLWEEPMKRLRTYKALNGDFNIRPDRPGYSDSLKFFVRVIRNQLIYIEGCEPGVDRSWLTAQDRRELKVIGFNHDITARCRYGPWDAKYKELLDYHQSNGGVNIPAPYYPQHRFLAQWVKQQRVLFSKGKLPVERIKKLHQLQFDWDPDKLQWKTDFEFLRDYYNEHGDVQHIDSEQHKILCQWCDDQRDLYAKKYMLQYRIDALAQLDFVWSHEEVYFNGMLQEVKRFCKKHGHSNIPQSYTANPTLALWAELQRQQYALYVDDKPSSMTNEHVDALEQEGFVFSAESREWEELLDVLTKFKSQHGHCNVPLWNPSNPRLGHFVSFQRKQLELFRQGLPCRLSKRRVNLLIKLGL
jgi:hypothetical protein